MSRTLGALLLVAVSAAPARSQPEAPQVEAPAAGGEAPTPGGVPAQPTGSEPGTAAPAPSPGPRTTTGAPLPATSGDVVLTHFPLWPLPRLLLEVEVYSLGRSTRRAGDDLSEVRLDRGELGGRLQLGPRAATELRIETIRSAPDGGALGIDGDSIVMRVKLAQVMGVYELGTRGTEPLLRVEGAFGFVPDPWIRLLEEDYTLKPLSRTGSERLLGWAVADLSGLVRASVGPVRATVAVGNGEGQRFPERNAGKTTTVVVDVVPVVDPVRLTISGVYRDGSIGVALIQERRYGAAASLISPWLRAGLELVKGDGIGDRPDASGLLFGGWADGRIVDRVFASARVQTLGFADGGGRLTNYGGGVAVEPWREQTWEGERARGRLRVWLGIERITSSGGAMPLLAADAGEATQLMLIASATAPFAIQ